MTLKRLMIAVGVLALVLGIGIAWLWDYAYSPAGRARVIFTQLGKDKTSLRGWMLEHGIIRPAYPPFEGSSAAAYVAHIDSVTKELARLGPDAYPVILETMDDGNMDVRFIAVRACGECENEVFIEPLVRQIEWVHRTFPRSQSVPADSPENLPPEEAWCIYALARIGPKAYPRLMEVEKNSSMRYMVPIGISAYWGREAVPRLIELLEDEDVGVREEAARGLWNNPDKRASQALVRHLHETSMNIASHCACALADIADPATIPGLLDAMRDKKVPITARVFAAGALARMKNQEGMAFLRAQMHSEDAEIRQTVAEALGPKIAGSLQMLQSMLDDKDSLTKMKALLSIEEFGKAACVPAAQRLLSGPDKDAGECAQNVLKRLQADSATSQAVSDGGE